MYFQASYIDGDFWKISGSGSPFTKANLRYEEYSSRKLCIQYACQEQTKILSTFFDL